MTEPTKSQEYSREEVGLALRNHGMHLEGLRYPVTPAGMHYLLIHYDIPFLDTTTYELPVGGLVRNPLRLTLDDLKTRPAVTVPVVMECSGNGKWSSQATTGGSRGASSKTTSGASRSRTPSTRG
jgi:hypothetical protein